MGKSVLTGAAAALILMGVYFLILAVANGPEHVLEQFMGMWYLILPLVAGFGIQMSLFSFIRSSMKAMTGAVASTGGMTTGSMVACCVHHVTDIVPVLGATALGLFLLQYQSAFMLLGILSNIVGITMMLYLIQKHSLHNGRFPSIFRFNMLNVRNMTAVISAVVFVAFVSLTALSTSPVNAQLQPGGLDLSAKYNSGNGLEISAKPVVSEDGIVFDLSFSTHSGDLDYDFTKISELVDSEGRSYNPLQWNGPPPGGHHISGRLLFPPLEGRPADMSLVIRGVYDVPERVFKWELQ